MSCCFGNSFTEDISWSIDARLGKRYRCRSTDRAIPSHFFIMAIRHRLPRICVLLVLALVHAKLYLGTLDSVREEDRSNTQQAKLRAVPQHIVVGSDAVNDDEVDDDRYDFVEEDGNDLQSKDVVDRSSDDDFLVLLTVNHGYLDFFLNWYSFFRDLNLPNQVVVVAEDSAIDESLRAMNLPQVSVRRSSLELEANDAFSFDSPLYNKLVSNRPKRVLPFLEKYPKVLYVDVDSVWLKDPFPYLSDPAMDVLAQNDIAELGQGEYVCTGFLAFRRSDRSLELIRKWEEEIDGDEMDQEPFNTAIRAMKDIEWNLLSSYHFPSGKYYFEDFTNEHREEAVVVHNNWISGHDAKRERFRDHGMWRIADDGISLAS